MLFIIIMFIFIISLLITNNIINYNINDYYNLLLLNYYIIIMIIIVILIYKYVNKHNKRINSNLKASQDLEVSQNLDSSQDLEDTQNLDASQYLEVSQDTFNSQQLLKCKCKPVLKIGITDIYNIFLDDKQLSMFSNNFKIYLEERFDNKIVFVLVYDKLNHYRIILTQIKDIKNNSNITVYQLNDALIDIICNIAYIDNYTVNNITGKFNKNGIFINFHNELKKFIKNSRNALILIAQ